MECAVAIVLLAGGSALLLLAAGTVARLVDDAALQDLALRVEATAAATATGSPCALHATARARRVHPRLELQEDITESGPLRRLRLRTQWRAATLAGGGLRERWTSTAGWCE